LSSSSPRPALLLSRNLAATFRAAEWWEYKIVPIAASFYATALFLDVPVSRLWSAGLLLLAALVPGAIYVSLVNDATDRRDDAAAGKANRLSGRAPFMIALLLGVPIAAGLGFAFLWRHDMPLLASYLAAWACFSLYSLPPFRLKVRGLPGVLADAAGANLFPTLVAVILAFRAAGAPIDLLWLGTAATLASAYGLRGILWHQLADLENDRAASVRTFAQRHSPQKLAAVARYLIFPAEAAALAALLWQMGNVLPPLFLLVYLLLVRRRVRWWEMKAVLVQPRPRYLILLQDYYGVFLPVSILVASAIAWPADLAVLAAHLLLFPNRIRFVAAEAWRLRTHASAHVPVS
jgi:hypothetical protein